MKPGVFDMSRDAVEKRIRAEARALALEEAAKVAERLGSRTIPERIRALAKEAPKGGGA